MVRFRDLASFRDMVRVLAIAMVRAVVRAIVRAMI
jgi:hypothetical protein